MSNAAQTPTPGYLLSRSYTTEAGPFSHAGGGSALTPGKMGWTQQTLAQLPANVGGYLQAQSAYAQADSWITTSFAGRWYALYMTASGPIYLTYGLVDSAPLGAATTQHPGPLPGPIKVVDPGQALANFSLGLATYITDHGCDGSATLSTLVQGYEGALNTFLDSTNVAHKAMVVDGIYSADIQKLLIAFSQIHDLAFKPCAGTLPVTAYVIGSGGVVQGGGTQGGGGITPSPKPTPTPSPAPAATGLSNNAKLGIGIGVLALTALGIWAYASHDKAKEKKR